MKQTLLFAAMLLALSGCAAGLVYDRDRQPADCRPDPDDRDGRRCLDAAVPEAGFPLSAGQSLQV